MRINETIVKNNVAAENQVDEKCKIFGAEEGAHRVLFIGNSITLHERAEHIGWYGEWGMAASEMELDYVHLVLSELRKRHGKVGYCITNVADWERNYRDDSAMQLYRKARDFSADTVVFRLGENVNREGLEKQILFEHLKKFTEYFTRGASKVIITDTFWEHEAICGACREVASTCGYDFVSLCDLGYDDANKALGLFEHDGVAAHPGDLGMKRIAERIIDKL